MERRGFVRGCGTVGLAGLCSSTGCTGLLSAGDESGRHVPSDWRPGPGEWAHSSAYGPGGNRYNPHATPPRSEPDVAWRSGHEDGRSAVSFAVADGTWFVRGASTLTALDTDDGDELWTAPRPSYGTVSYVDGRLYDGLREAAEALTLDGETEWRIDESGRFAGEMGGYVYYGTEAGLGWYDSDTGERLGRVQLDSERQGAMGGTVYGLGRDSIAAYDHDDSEPSRRWFTPYEDPDGVETAWAVIAEETIYAFPVRDSRTTGYERFDLDGERLGSQTWKDLLVGGLVVVDDVEYLFLVEPDPEGDDRYHLRASDGETRWERSFGPPASRHAVADGTVYLEADGDLVALDAGTGETRWRLPGVGGEVALVGDTVYVNGEELYALRA